MICGYRGDTMDKTEFMERLRKAAALQAEKKKAQQERFRAMMEKIKAREGTV